MEQHVQYGSTYMLLERETENERSVQSPEEYSNMVISGW